MSIGSVINNDFLNGSKEIFDIVDENHDGYIESNCIERILRKLGFNPSIEDMCDIIEETEGKSISFFSLIYIIYRFSRNVDTFGELVDSLEAFDKKKTGMLSVTFLSNLLQSVRTPYTNEQIRSVFRSLDDENGFVRIKDFLKALLELE